MAKPVKTNAMRMLDKANIPFESISYTVDESDLSGVHVADQVGLPYEKVFKTLVAKGDKTGPVVFCIPVHLEINLKKAATATKNKRVELIAVKDLLGLTGYIRGGCSPIGMKKNFPTFFHTEAENHEKIAISAGVRGCQLFLDRKMLVDFVQGSVCDLCD